MPLSTKPLMIKNKMHVTIHQQEQGLYIIEGELNMQTVPAASKQLLELIASVPEKKFTLDLKGVSRSDSAGVALLVEVMQIAKIAELSLSFSHLPQQMQDIAGVSGLLDILPISNS